MGFFGTRKEVDYDKPEEESEDKEEDEDKEEEIDDEDEETEEKSEAKNFVGSIKELDERQLLMLLVLLKYEDNYESISEDSDGLIKIVKGEK